jgi:hypothetical protein
MLDIFNQTKIKQKTKIFLFSVEPTVRLPPGRGKEISGVTKQK